MAQKNLEIVRRILDAWGQGDFRSQAERLDPEISFETFMPDAGENVVAHGIAEVGAFTRNWFEQWRDYRIVVAELRDVGSDKVLASVRQLATGRHSGALVDSPGFCVFTIRGGKVVKLSLHYDRSEALKAAGLRE